MTNEFSLIILIKKNCICSSQNRRRIWIKFCLVWLESKNLTEIVPSLFLADKNLRKKYIYHYALALR